MNYHLMFDMSPEGFGPRTRLSDKCSSVSLSNLQEYVYPDARDRQYLLFFHKGVKRTRFDIEKYNKLKEDIAEVQSPGESWMFCD